MTESKPETFSRYDTADYLKSEEDIIAYLNAVTEDGGNDPASIVRALAAIARARKWDQLSISLFENKNPSFYAIVRIAREMGLRLEFKISTGAKAYGAGSTDEIDEWLRNAKQKENPNENT